MHSQLSVANDAALKEALEKAARLSATNDVLAALLRPSHPHRRRRCRPSHTTRWRGRSAGVLCGWCGLSVISAQEVARSEHLAFRVDRQAGSRLHPSR